MAWPTELRFRRAAGELCITFDDGHAGTIPFRTLRQESPSAENKGHGGRRPSTRPVIQDDIDVVGAEPVGRYAVRIAFSDGHKTGLYTWALLRELCRPSA